MENLGSFYKKTINVGFVVIESKYILILIFVLFILFKPFFLNNLSGIMVFSYSLLYATCCAFSNYAMNLLIKNMKGPNRCPILLLPVYTIIVTAISFLLILFIRLFLDSFFGIGFDENKFILKGDLSNLFYEIFEIFFFLQVCLSSILTFAKVLSIEQPKAVEAQLTTNEIEVIRLVEDKKNNEDSKVNIDFFLNRELVIKGINKNEEFTVNSSLILYIKAEGHYFKVFYYSEKYKKIKFNLIRNSLKVLMKDLEEVCYLIRIHKSYVVNLKNVKYLRMNKTIGLVCLDQENIKLPVSKTYLENANSLIRLYFSDKVK